MGCQGGWKKDGAKLRWTNELAFKANQTSGEEQWPAGNSRSFALRFRAGLSCLISEFTGVSFLAKGSAPLSIFFIIRTSFSLGIGSLNLALRFFSFSNSFTICQCSNDREVSPKLKDTRRAMVIHQLKSQLPKLRSACLASTKSSSTTFCISDPMECGNDLTVAKYHLQASNASTTGISEDSREEG